VLAPSLGEAGLGHEVPSGGAGHDFKLLLVQVRTTSCVGSCTTFGTVTAASLATMCPLWYCMTMRSNLQVDPA
jgi:hypothetical protein